jgi:hypothetical protein
MFKKIGMFLVLISLVFSGCATKFVNDAGKELPASLGYAIQVIEASQTIYDTTLSVAGDLHCNKKLSDESAYKIIAVSNTAYMAINTAQVAVDNWNRALEIKGDTATAKNTTYMQLLNLSRSIIALINDYQELTGKSVQIPPVILESEIVNMFGGK